ncbi:IS30 family transposase, partial [Lactiplantibacillus pentosus]
MSVEIEELTSIYSLWKLNKKTYRVARALHRCAETVDRIVLLLDGGNTLIDYQE